MKWILLMIVLLGMGCGPLPNGAQPEPLVDKQPWVKAVTPAAESVLGTSPELRLTFSQPIQSTTVNDKAVVLVEAESIPTKASDLDELASLPLERVLSADHRDLQLRALSPLSPGIRYAVVVTPALMSEAWIPFNQTPGGAPSPFVAKFVVGGDATAASAAIPPVTVSTKPSTPPALPATPPSIISPEPLMINELLYDITGDDTNGVLFMELRGTPKGDVGGYKVSFINGDDGVETESVVIPKGVVIPESGLLTIADGITGDLQHTHVANATFVDNFDPQNGPDSVHVFSADGKLLDAVAYGAAKAIKTEKGFPLWEGNPGPDAPANMSISRLEEADDTDDNAADFVINTQPSPGSHDVTP